MPAHGKVDSDFLERVVYPRLGADRVAVRGEGDLVSVRYRLD
jgi:hypothetical protein